MELVSTVRSASGESGRFGSTRYSNCRTGPHPGGWVAALIGVLAAWSCGTGVPGPDEAWSELRDPERQTDSQTADRRLLLARVVLENPTLPSGAGARFPLGYAHLVEHLTARRDQSRYGDFDRLSRAIEGGRLVRAELRLDVGRVEAGSRAALEQTVELRSSGRPPAVDWELWIPARAPGFPRALEATDVRVELARVGGGWTRAGVRPVRPGGLGPPGFAASIPAATERFRVIYGESGGFSMPVRAGSFVLPLWLGREPGVLFGLGESPLQVVATAPEAVRLRGPSVVRPGQVFALELRRTDRFGNDVGETLRPAMDLWAGDQIERRFPAGTGTRLTVDGLSRTEEGVVRYRVESADGLVGWSAPILVREDGPSLVWGDPVSMRGACSQAVSGGEAGRCVRWAGCHANGIESGDCDPGGRVGTLWLGQIQMDDSSIIDATTWGARIGLYTDGLQRGVLAFSTLELLESGGMTTSADWRAPEVGLLGTGFQLGGAWPGEVATAGSALTGVWMTPESERDGGWNLRRTIATSGARIIVDCEPPGEATVHARCAVHGTAPVWRVDLLRPAMPAIDPRPDAATETWAVVHSVRPLETEERSLLLLTWSRDASEDRRPVPADGELTLEQGQIKAVSLFGDALEATALGRDGLAFRQLGPPTRGGLLAGLGTPAAADQRLRLDLRMDGREEIIDFLAREVPFRRPLESGWLEADWVAERPLLDLNQSFPELDPADLHDVLVLVQQVDGEIAVTRFTSVP